MKKKSLKSIWWVLKLQYQTARAAFIWNFIYHIYDGIISIVGAYVAAKLLTSITQIASGSNDTRQVYVWLGVLLAIEIVGIVLLTLNNLISRRASQKLEIAASEQFYTKLYQLSQAQFDNEEFNTMVSRAQDGLLRLWQVTNELTWATSALVRFIASITAIMVVAPAVAIVIVIAIIPITLVRNKRNKIDEEATKKAEPIQRIAYRTRWYLLDPENMPEIRLVGGFKNLLQSWRKDMNKTYDMEYEVDKKTAKFDVGTDIVQPFIEFLANVYFFRLLVAGTIGLDKFLFLRGIIDQASGSAASLTNSFNKLHELSIDLDNFDKLKSTEPAIPSIESRLVRVRKIPHRRPLVRR
jgi:ABC-type bacteriocin/lantibiotic exporter with double-glycine peptidase domain